MSGQPRLPPGQQLAAPGKWPLVGERRPREDASPWSVALEGLVESPCQLTLAQLAALPQTNRVVDIHCVTRWSRLDAGFGGVMLADLLALCRPRPEARYVSFVARSPRSHSTSLLLDDALKLQAMVALFADAAPLDTIHGGPVRIVVPGRYFYKSLKWLERIELLAEDRLGYWEAEAGYHNTADPWREQRYMAPNLNRFEVQRLLDARDFCGRNLRSLDASGRDLIGLRARDALLRDADFRRAKLVRASFASTNLSNARFAEADLRGASFDHADLEGADFSGADLRGADLRGAMLTAATFVTGELAARFDATTRVDERSLEELMPEQADFVRRSLAKA
jgi:DMSO/TMAO reductase YedYZ molybdopterin-dependent catalytic subunit